MHRATPPRAPSRILSVGACAMFLGLAGLVGLAGCSSLLPRSESEDISPFDSYEAARVALEQVVPYRTTMDELKALGFDIGRSANVQRIPYPQWVGLIVHPGTPLDRTDVGIRDCIAAEQGCQALVFRFGRVERERRGGFLVDFFNFHRLTRTYGWRFEGTVLARDGTVLFRNHGGQPNIELVEDRWNPLGPFQSIGESASRAVMP